jgi:hypothetical protein
MVRTANVNTATSWRDDSIPRCGVAGLTIELATTESPSGQPDRDPSTLAVRAVPNP